MFGSPDDRKDRGPEDGAPQDLGVFLDQVTNDAKGWVQAQKEYTILIASERFGRMSGSLVGMIVLMVFLAGALFMCTAALALYLGQVLGSIPLGFVCVGGLYLLLAGLFHLFGRRKIQDLVTLTIINSSRDEDPIP
ncbi:MAG: phage holin family protein [Flavobacteriales bacterium]